MLVCFALDNAASTTDRGQLVGLLLRTILKSRKLGLDSWLTCMSWARYLVLA